MTRGCPSDASLRRLADDDHDPAGFAEKEAHVAGCEACRGRLGRLAWEVRTPPAGPPHEGRPAGPPPRIDGFEVLRELGRGGMGIVYLARQHSLGRLVALKLVPGGAGPGEAARTARRRWLREARATAGVRHPHIVQLHGCGEDGGRLFLTMEYIPGGSLKERLDASPPSPREAARLMEAVARAVGHIHSAGQLHLDLKPSNILLDGEPGGPWEAAIPKVADFGLSLTAESLSDPDLSQHSPRGTPTHMAPEQATGDVAALGPAADVWALGVLLYRLLAGRNPFQAASHIETIERVRHDAPAPLRRLNPKVPRGLEAVALKCLEKDPSRRYPAGADVADDLRRWLDGRDVLARRGSTARRAWRGLRRLTPAGLMAVVLAGTAGLGTMLAVPLAEARRARAAERPAAHLRVVEHLENQILAEIREKRSASAEELDASIGLLREQVASLRAGGRLDAAIVLGYSQIEDYVVSRYRGDGRFDEARALDRRRLDLLRECRRRDPGEPRYANEAAHALLSLGTVELEAGRLEEALDDFDLAAAEILAAPARDADLLATAVCLSASYALVLDAAPDVAGSRPGARAGAGQSALLGHFRDLEAGSPDVALFRACLLADRARSTTAGGLSGSIPACRLIPGGGRRSVAGEDLLALGLYQWYLREVRYSEALAAGRPSGPSAIGREADRIAGGLMRWRDDPRGTDPALGAALRGMHNAFATDATRRRGAGDIAGAERAIGLFDGIAGRVVRDRPGWAQGYAFLAEARMQDYKNGWKRGDPPDALRLRLRDSIGAIRRGLAIEPSNAELRAMLLDKETRLAGLAGE
ncbi:Serine/threonine-protein kinase PrkC [Aquisphaera giovannonii]|uniref:Serine/threonine-protein kinase PrkC n=1 Tax=Aquisphaera giovannonii TaxID=406548 RepID=A0A5B9VV53_9BACT|nr:serine/threonine-protein kinase [Aquisphaera giovannonii]QEH31691.1 Serine/threonine-protein kinase PrkC [Aquisphaera giovannonii]